jgi:general secretion pathway protein M
VTQLQTLQIRWNALNARDKLGLYLIAAVLGLALLWGVLLAPAVRTLRFADAEHRRLDAQLQQMRRLQAQAQALQAQPRIRRDEAVRALEQSVKQWLGANAQLSVNGERATLTVKGVSPESLVQWFAQARINAHAALKEARLMRNSPPNAPAAWDGTLLLALPDKQ